MTSAPSPQVVSVGYEGRSVEELVQVLRAEDVAVLVDIRLTPISRKRGLSKTALTRALRDAGIEPARSLILSAMEAGSSGVTANKALLAADGATLYEAAALDGAGVVRRFLHVTVPGCRSTMVLIMLLSSAAAFRVFNEIYVLTNGSAGPGGMDMTMSMLIKREGTGIQARTGYASAISIVVLVIVGVMLIVQQILQKRGED